MRQFRNEERDSNQFSVMMLSHLLNLLLLNRIETTSKCMF